jgi:glycosyltransferase involved in cell wall biosynthesis
MIGSGGLESVLRARIKATSYGDHLLLVGDLAHVSTLRILTKADLMLRTTLYDGDSISVREALALGLPVVATDNAMRPAGVNLVSQDDAGELLRTATELLRSEPVINSSALDRTDNIAKVLKLYDELTNSQSK